MEKPLSARSRPMFRVLLLLFLAPFLAASAQEVFKWTDENGVVQYGDSVPEGIDEFERVTLELPPPAPAQPVASPAPIAPTSDVQPVRVVPAPPDAVAAPPSPSQLSLEALDQQCEAARERAIAPLRAEAIAECKTSGRNDPTYCERFYADFGDGGRTATGAMRPRMFDDLPECVTALQERNSRADQR
ncbi:MAG: DUF4124 domain-containing protein [Gammaproteobacteria bacterium]